jgi:hypothetical protein
LPSLPAPLDTAGVGLRAIQTSLSARLARAHLAKHGANALLGLTGLTFLAALLALETLQRCQKPRRFWLSV